jgi:exoribonuclease R
MDAAERRSHDLEAAIVDAAEAVLLSGDIGREFEAAVVRIRGRAVTVQLTDPPVRAEIPAAAFAPGGAPEPAVAPGGSALEGPGVRVGLGDRLVVRLVSADPAKGAVTFEPAGGGRAV